VLSTDLKARLALTLDESKPVNRSEHVKRVVTEREIKQAFGRARWLSEQEQTFLQTLSWFRKALERENPLDRFFSFLLTLEIIVGL